MGFYISDNIKRTAIVCGNSCRAICIVQIKTVRRAVRKIGIKGQSIVANKVEINISVGNNASAIVSVQRQRCSFSIPAIPQATSIAFVIQQSLSAVGPSQGNRSCRYRLCPRGCKPEENTKNSNSYDKYKYAADNFGVVFQVCFFHEFNLLYIFTLLL